jgi:hypothetical protein
MFRFGRQRPAVKGSRYHLRDYFLTVLPEPPTTTDWTQKALPFLANVLANDQLGDCLSAGLFHIDGVMLANAGEPIPYTAQNVIDFYSAACGYVAGDPSTDNGSDEKTVLDYAEQHGLLPDGSHKLTAWVEIDATNEQEVRQAIYLFENAYICVELPNEYVSPFPAGDGFTWDVAGDPNPEQGHCFVALGYSDEGVLIDTWGMLGVMTWAALAKYASPSSNGSLATLLSPDSIIAASKKSPIGFDMSQLLIDINSIAA